MGWWKYCPTSEGHGSAAAGSSSIFCRLIVCLRNPKDVLTSLHFFRGEAKDGWLGNEHGPGSLARFIHEDCPRSPACEITVSRAQPSAGTGRTGGHARPHQAAGQRAGTRSRSLQSRALRVWGSVRETICGARVSQ